MILRVVAKKNVYFNQKGKKKVRILTANKVYIVNKIFCNMEYEIVDDIGRSLYFEKNYFINLSKKRENVLDKLLGG